jgi:hypothetical protein
MLGEPSSPPPDQTRRGIEPRRDLRVRHPLGGVEHDPRALHILERQLLRPRAALKHHALLFAEFNPVTSRARHRHILRPRPPDSFNQIPTDTSGRVY